MYVLSVLQCISLYYILYNKLGK